MTIEAGLPSLQCVITSVLDEDEDDDGNDFEEEKERRRRRNKRRRKRTVNLKLLTFIS